MNNSSKSSFSLLSIVCQTIGHKYVETRKITNHISEYKCSHCGREVTENSAGKIELLTKKVKEINNNVADFFERKKRKVTA
ncbi:hypothetical protein INR76_03240 [Marixanthomonas sp. SCSIO 43207]|uniref:hypothetical protein n=1 Tax=Marixanthomonas sp. SCSIO 43207 TaxID=2779360 RepID=UPI001CA8ED02|nr:hypothetical protein [Marixanthomonas sp. SCSIO 43207]UAB81786.1 hypothetical protein INR76_03240 [Marixanthomonas sp. SCSIO 43207]